MYKRITFFLISHLICISAFAQDSTRQKTNEDNILTPKDIEIKYLWKLPKFNLKFNLESEAFSNSTAIPASFSNSFLFPRFIDETIKNNAIDRLNTKNRFGAFFQNKIGAIFYPDSSWKAQQQAIEIYYKNQNIIGSQFNSDFFQLIFNGNAQFAGQTADLSNSRFSNLNFESFNIGYIKTSRLNSFSMYLGLVRGRSYTDLNIINGGLFTASNGTQLDVDFNGSFVQSSRFSNFFKATPSMGASFGLEYNLQLSRGINLDFKAEDIGFINWNENTDLITRDTSFVFNGLSINDLIDTDKDLAFIGDSLLNKLRGPSIKGNNMSALPAFFQTRISKYFLNKWSASFTINYRYFTGYSLLKKIEIGKRFRKERYILFSIAQGGFGNFQTGIQFVLINSEKHFLKIGTIANEGFISKKMSGNGIMINYNIHL
jgi:hypothetical protein